MNVYITNAKRTPIGRLLGQYKKYSAAALGSAVLKELLSHTKATPTQVIMGQVLTAGAGQNPARQSALKAGLPESTVCATVNMVCGSGLYSVILGAQAINSGQEQSILAGGQESMTAAPFLLPKQRPGTKLGHSKIIDSIITDGLHCAFKDYHMGITAENIAKKYSISREDQDQFSHNSHRKAQHASEQGFFAKELIALSDEDTDQQIRCNASTEDFSKLQAVFDPTGTVTAGNASGINDGAAAVLLSNTKENSMAKICGYGLTGLDPAIMGMGPVQAIKNCLTMAGWSMNDVDLFECNEAFACQSLAVARELAIPDNIININGGAIALGHPIGASGCRILTTLLYALQRTNSKRGIAALCIGGGQGIALAIERT